MRPLVVLRESSWGRRGRWAACSLHRLAIAAAITAVAMPVAPMHALAADYFWDVDGNGSANVGGTGNWDTTSLLWRLGSETGTLSLWPSGNDLAILGGASGVVTLAEPITAGGRTFSSAGYTIAGNTLTLAGPGGTIATLGHMTINSLKLTATASTPAILQTAGTTLTIDSGGILTTGNFTKTLGTNSACLAANGGALYVHNNQSTLTIARERRRLDRPNETRRRHTRLLTTARST